MVTNTALLMIKDAVRFASWEAKVTETGLIVTREDYSKEIFLSKVEGDSIEFVFDLDDIGQPFDAIEHVRIIFEEENTNINSLISQMKYHYGLYERLWAA